MITWFVTFLCSLMVAATLTIVVRNRALAYGWVDRIKSSRKIHRQAVPRLGGIAIITAFYAPLAALLVVDSSVGHIFTSQTQLVWGLFLGGLVIAALGLYDDFRGAGAPLKFAVQVALTIGLYQAGFRIETLANPFGPELHLGAASLPLTLLWTVGVINAMNLIDGLDGLAGGVAFIGVATNFVLAATRGDVIMSLLMASLAGAILGFLLYNFNPASIFMGDAGSMFLGFILAVASIRTSTKSGTVVALLVPIIALGLPIMDTLLAMVRRGIGGRSMFSADKEHIHHRLMSRVQLSHRNAVLVLYCLSCLFALTALGLSYANSTQSALLLAGIGIVILVLMRKLGYLQVRHPGVIAQVRRKNIELRTAVRAAVEAIANAERLSDIWEATWPLAAALGAARLELAITREAVGLNDRFSFSTLRPAGTALPLDARFDIRVGTLDLGTLAVTWRDSRIEIDRDDELAIELIVDSIADNAIRLIRVADDGTTGDQQSADTGEKH